MSTVIIGGGIIGLSTAYYLSLQQPELASSGQIQVIDSAPSLLLSASGYAGGFLAKDWFSPAVSSLGALSFRLHRELADAHDGARKWGYAASTAYSLSLDEVGVSGVKTGKKAKGKDWLLEGTSRADVAIMTDTSGDGRTSASGRSDPSGQGRDEMLNEDGTPAWITKQEGGTLEVISSEDGCGQVEPRELCEWLQQECRRRGVVFHLNVQPTSLIKDGSGSRVKGIKADTKTGPIELEGKHVVLAAGAWTSKLFKTLFPNSRTRIGIGPLAGYSIVVRSPRYSRPIVDPARHEGPNGSCHAVFCAPGPNWSYAPEMISRIPQDGKPEIYVAGLNDAGMTLPVTAAGVKGLAIEQKMRELRETTVLLTGLSNEGDELVDDDLEVVREGLCFRPISDSGRPVVTKLDKRHLGKDAEMYDDGGVYVAAGHGPWGISLSLGTGLVVSEMIQGKKTSAHVVGLGVR